MSRTMLDELQARRLGLFNELSQSDTEADRYSDLATRHRDIAAGIRQKIGDLDKAIAALSPAPPTVSDREEEGGLLESQPEPSAPEVRKEDEQDAAASVPSDSWAAGHRAGFSAADRNPNGSENWQRGYAVGERDRARNIELGEEVPNYDGTHPEPPPPQKAPAIPEGEEDWDTRDRRLGYEAGKAGLICDVFEYSVAFEGGYCEGREVAGHEWPLLSGLEDFLKRPDAVRCNGVARMWGGEIVETYRRDRTSETGLAATLLGWSHTKGEPSALDIIAYRILTPQTQPETSALDKVEDAPPGGGANVFLEQAEAAILDKSEDELATPQQLEAEGITEPGASEIAAMRMAHAPKKFGGIFSFGAKKTMAEEGV